MKTAIMNMAMGMMAACLALSAMATDPAITDVTVRQRWPWSRLVDIDYTLTRDDEQYMDVQISAFDGETALVLPDDSFSGDLYGVSRGSRRIVWDPSKTAYTNQALTRFRVELTVTDVPLYMIIDLTKTAGATDQIAYVYEEELTNGLWGAWERDFVQTNGVPVVESVIWTGVTTNDIYKKDKLVLRRVPADTFTTTAGSGYTSETVTFANGFYASVFELTEAQWWKTLDNISTIQSPRINTSYDDLRGSTNNVPPVDWPATGSFVSPTNFIGQLRAKTGFNDFDLPTEAQWEYLCRAGTTTRFNDGDAYVVVSTVSGATNDNLDLLGWYRYNEMSLHTVGLKRPNAWGLYDTHGNVWEMNLNKDGARVFRGGSWNAQGYHCCPDYRIDIALTSAGNNLGFRLVRTLQ